MTKRILYGILITIGSLFLLLAGLLMLARLSSVQTYFARQLTQYISEQYKIDFQVSKVHLRLHHLDLYDIYLSDQNKDTLAAIPRASFAFHPLALRRDELKFSSVSISQPYISLSQDSSTTNFAFLQDIFRTDSTATPFPYTLILQEVKMENGRISFYHQPSDNHLSLSHIDITLQAPIIAADTLSAQLDKMSFHAELNRIDGYINGVLRGNRDSLFAEEVELVYRDQRVLLGSITISHPLDMENLDLNVYCQDLMCHRYLLQDLFSDFLRKPITLPSDLAALGTMHYRGLLSGRLADLRLHGAFITKLGTITTNCTMAMDTSFADIRLRGQIASKHFLLQPLFPNNHLGNLSASAETVIHYRRNRPIDIRGAFNIEELSYNDYTYRDLHINGQLTDSLFRGACSINDPNIALNLQGDVNFSSLAPAINIQLRTQHLRLEQLHLIDPDKVDSLDIQFATDVKVTTTYDNGKWVDNFNGHIAIDSLTITNFGRVAHLNNIRIIASNQNAKNSLRLQSDFLTMGINGSFRWTNMSHTLQNIFHDIMPNTVQKPTITQNNNNFDFYLYGRGMDSILSILQKDPISIPQNPTIKGYVSGTNKEYELKILVPSIEKDNYEMRNLTVSLVQRNAEAKLNMAMETRIINLDSTKLRIKDIGYRFHTTARHDSLLTAYRFGYLDSEHDDADIHVATHIGIYNRQPIVSVHILPSVFYMSDTIWALKDSHIEYAFADSTLSIQGFAMRSHNQFIRANGVASHRQEDSLRIDMKNIDLGYFLQYTGVSKAISIGGNVSGWVTLHHLFDRPTLESNLRVPKAQLNSTSIGDVTAIATLDPETKHVLIQGDAHLNKKRIIHIDGNIIPENNYWELFLQTDSVDLAMLNFWTNGILENVTGDAYGKIHIFGKQLDTWVTARLLAKQAALSVPYTGARYYFSDSIIMDTTSIVFQHLTIHDEEGHTGTVDGVIQHQCFRDFQFRIGANFTNLLAINLPYSSQSMYYGKVHATGKLDIQGVKGYTRIGVKAITNKNTDFYLCVGTASDAKDNSFITFKHKEDPLTEYYKKKLHTQTIKPQETNVSETLLDLDINATKNAQLHLTFDPHTGDGITGRGTGELRFTLSSTKAQLYGTYTLQQGTFSYAVANLIRRNCTIQEGSSITWNGDPISPNIDITAKYKLTASLKDLFGDDISSLATNRTSVPVECTIRLGERLTNPVLRFGIELPQSDEAIAAQVKSVINTDEMLTRQVIYLLVFNRFFTPEYIQNSTANKTYSLLTSTLTGQINSWLSKLTDVVSVGFDFRTDGEGTNASQEYEAQFQINPVNRLSINGNVGYRTNDLSNRPFFGDIDMEYQLTPNGKLRAKAYTHTVDKYSLKQASTVQGLGLIFRHDFNWGDAKKKRNLKNNHTPDSTKQHIIMQESNHQPTK